MKFKKQYKKRMPGVRVNIIIYLPPGLGGKSVKKLGLFVTFPRVRKVFQSRISWRLRDKIRRFFWGGRHEQMPKSHATVALYMAAYLYAGSPHGVQACTTNPAAISGCPSASSCPAWRLATSPAPRPASRTCAGTSLQVS